MTFLCDSCGSREAVGFRLEALSPEDGPPDVRVPAHICAACAPPSLTKLVVRLYQLQAARELVGALLEEAKS